MSDADRVNVREASPEKAKLVLPEELKRLFIDDAEGTRTANYYDNGVLLTCTRHDHALREGPVIQVVISICGNGGHDFSTFFVEETGECLERFTRARGDFWAKYVQSGKLLAMLTGGETPSSVEKKGRPDWMVALREKFRGCLSRGR